MIIILTTILVLLCLLVVMLILIQRTSGGMGSALGGGTADQVLGAVLPHNYPSLRYMESLAFFLFYLSFCMHFISWRPIIPAIYSVHELPLL